MNNKDSITNIIQVFMDIWFLKSDRDLQIKKVHGSNEESDKLDSMLQSPYVQCYLD